MQRKGFDLNRIRDLYYKFGVKNLTMDDVAHEMGISKRTLYQHVKTKNDLVALLLDEDFEKFKGKVDMLLKETNGPIPKLYGLYKAFEVSLKPLSPVFVFSLSKTNPELTANIRKQYHNLILEVVTTILTEGQNEGDFIADFSVDFPRLVAGYILQLGAWHLVEEDEKIQLKSAFYLQIGGYCTEQGKKKLDRFIKNID